MNNLNSAPTFFSEKRVQKVDDFAFRVYKTHDYSKFKALNGNRNLNMLHVSRLIQSFKVNHLVSPIIVNENFEVIDGQHRLRASIKAEKPVYYMIVPGYNLQEVQVYNTNMKNWGKNEFLDMYCDLGYEPYLKFKKFMSDFPDFGIQACERIITQLGGTGGPQGYINGKKVSLRSFEEGKLHIPDINKSYVIARKLLDFKPFYKNFNRGTFVSTFLQIFKHKNYDHNLMIRRLGTCPHSITDQPNVEAYKLQLEDIFNWRNRTPVSLRYE